MSPVTCIGNYTQEGEEDSMTLRNTFAFPGDKTHVIYIEYLTKIVSGRRENTRQFYLS